jgi:hypothetical protein
MHKTHLPAAVVVIEQALLNYPTVPGHGDWYRVLEVPFHFSASPSRRHVLSAKRIRQCPASLRALIRDQKVATGQGPSTALLEGVLGGHCCNWESS